MSVIRISEFRAAEGKTGGLRDFLVSIVPGIEASEGCISCRLLQDRGDETKFVVVEDWESAEAHEASVGEVSTDQLQEVTQLLAGPPQGRYLSELSETSETSENKGVLGGDRK